MNERERRPIIDAHYGTTPADLERVLDAPNLAAHAVIRVAPALRRALLADVTPAPPLDAPALPRARRGHPERYVSWAHENGPRGPGAAPLPPR